MTMVNTSQPARDTPPKIGGTHAPRRRWRTRLLIVCGVVLSLAWLLDFDPLHPIHWVHELRAAFAAGQRAGAAARRRNAQHPAAPAPTSTPAR